MKKLILLLILSVAPMLAFAQSDSLAPAPAPCPDNGVTLNPSNWNYGTLARDFNYDKVFNICNESSSNLRITGFQANPTPPFSVIGNTCPANLPAGSHCTITVQAVVGTVGQKSGSLTVECNAEACPLSSNLGATGEKDVTLGPPSWNFGGVWVGQVSAPATFTLTNNEPVALHITNIQTEPQDVFEVLQQPGSCKTTHAVPAGASCNIYVEFRPIEPGPVEGTLTVTDDSRDGTPGAVSLSGTGIYIRCPPDGCGHCPPSGCQQ